MDIRCERVEDLVMAQTGADQVDESWKRNRTMVVEWNVLVVQAKVGSKTAEAVGEFREEKNTAKNVVGVFFTRAGAEASCRRCEDLGASGS